MRRNRRERRSTGQALVEFALVAPLLFLVMFSIIEFGRFVYYNEVLNDAVREGARYAIVHGNGALCPSGPMPGTGTAGNPCDPNGDRIRGIIKAFAVGTLQGPMTISLCWGPASGCLAAPPTSTNNGRDQDFWVKVDYAYQTLIPVVPLPPFTISAESRLVINH
jgi:TadE-like protein